MWFKETVFSSKNKNSSQDDSENQNLNLNQNAKAKHLHVSVIKNGVETVRVALPAQSARWLIEIIPTDVVEKIRAEKIPLDDILDELKNRKELLAQPIFKLKEPDRTVDVWLE